MEPKGSGLLGFISSFRRWSSVRLWHLTDVASANSSTLGGRSFALYHQISQNYTAKIERSLDDASLPQ